MTADNKIGDPKENLSKTCNNCTMTIYSTMPNKKLAGLFHCLQKHPQSSARILAFKTFDIEVYEEKIHRLEYICGDSFFRRDNCVGLLGQNLRKPSVHGSVQSVLCSTAYSNGQS